MEPSSGAGNPPCEEQRDPRNTQYLPSYVWQYYLAATHALTPAARQYRLEEFRIWRQKHFPDTVECDYCCIFRIPRCIIHLTRRPGACKNHGEDHEDGHCTFYGFPCISLEAQTRWSQAWDMWSAANPGLRDARRNPFACKTAPERHNDPRCNSCRSRHYSNCDCDPNSPMGCTSCRVLDQDCRFIDSYLPPRPDGLVKPLACDCCAERNIKTCSWRHTRVQNDTVLSICDNCQTNGFLCKLGGQVVQSWSIAAKGGPRHLWLTSTLPDMSLRPAHQVEYASNPTLGYALHFLTDQPALIDIGPALSVSPPRHLPQASISRVARERGLPYASSNRQLSVEHINHIDPLLRNPPPAPRQMPNVIRLNNPRPSPANYARRPIGRPPNPSRCELCRNGLNSQPLRCGAMPGVHGCKRCADWGLVCVVNHVPLPPHPDRMHSGAGCEPKRFLPCESCRREGRLCDRKRPCDSCVHHGDSCTGDTRGCFRRGMEGDQAPYYYYRLGYWTLGEQEKKPIGFDEHMLGVFYQPDNFLELFNAWAQSQEASQQAARDDDSYVSPSRFLPSPSLSCLMSYKQVIPEVPTIQELQVMPGAQPIPPLGSQQLPTDFVAPNPGSALSSPIMYQPWFPSLAPNPPSPFSAMNTASYRLMGFGDTVDRLSFDMNFETPIGEPMNHQESMAANSSGAFPQVVMSQPGFGFNYDGHIAMGIHQHWRQGQQLQHSGTSNEANRVPPGANANNVLLQGLPPGDTQLPHE